MKKVYIGTSWKMNKTLSEALLFCQQLNENFPSDLKAAIQPFIIPPHTVIRDVHNDIIKNKIPCLTGVQNMHFEDFGAFTGEISPIMVKDTGAAIVEIGHSERREFFGETDITVHKKVYAALKHQLTPLICIGDSAEDKRLGVSIETVVKQMKIAISGLTSEALSKIIIAYEPIWAIGEHGIPASPDEAELIHQHLRYALAELYNEQIANRVPFLYGGSVNPQNAASLIQQPNIDGLFIGRSAWQAEGFCNILSIINKII